MLCPTAKRMKVFALLSTKICQSKFLFIFASARPALYPFSQLSMCVCGKMGGKVGVAGVL